MTHSSSGRLMAFIGSYANASDPGLYVCTFDERTGSLTLESEVSGLQNPTFLDVDSANRRLYAIKEIADAEGKRRGAAAAYAIDPEQGRLELLNDAETVPGPTCHILLEPTRRNLLVASYHGGMIGLIPLEADGRIGKLADMHQHEGSSVHPAQDKPHPHSVFPDRANRYAVVPDLGLDRIKVYKLDLEAQKLIPNGEIAVEPGAGPRHFTFHPSLARGYVINELNSTITAFEYDEEAGRLTHLQTVSTLPNGFEGDNACADIHLSPDGRFLYGSNRGHDSIVVFAVNPADGTLTLVEHVSTGGKHPRNFALTPDGRCLLAANRDTDNVVVFARDEATGKLTPKGQELNVSKPVCVKFMTIA